MMIASQFDIERVESGLPGTKKLKRPNLAIRIFKKGNSSKIKKAN
jgi:hypothetical protein